MNEIENNNLILKSIKTWSDELGISIHMPRIQRDFIWNPKQIALLWDSLLRGMPFGSLLVLKINNSTEVKDERNKKLKKVDSGWQLLDGQQRSRSIKGGFEFDPAQSPFKVWIGCNKSNCSELKFDIKVTTRAHPFGFNKDFQKLDLNSRRAAFKEHGEDKDLSLVTASPYVHATNDIYIPLNKLLDDVYGKDETEVMAKLKLSFNLTEDNSLIKELALGLSNLKETHVVAQVVDRKFLGQSVDVKEDENLDIEVLFKRIGSGGTNLSNLDYAYSIIKQELPEAYKFIEGTLQNKPLQRIFSPLDLISITLRSSCALACREKNNSAITRDDISYSKVNISKILTNDENKQLIVELLNDETLTRALNDVFELLLFDKENNPQGLPLALLNQLHISTWQILVFWRLGKDGEVQATELIKFVMYGQLFKVQSKDLNMLSKKCMEVIKDNDSCEFPATALMSEYLTLNDSMIFTKLPSYISFENKIRNPEVMRLNDNKIRGNSLRCGNFEEVENRVFHHFWNKKELLLWLQRNYVTNLSKNENSKIAPEMTPYDYDHIVPQNYWSNLGSSKGRTFDQYLDTKMDWRPNRQLGNSIGNYQLLGFSDNRGKNDIDYPSFYEDLKNNKMIDNVDSYLADDLLLSKSSQKLFLKTLKKADDWESEAVANFQAAVELRTCDLYKQFLELFKGDNNYCQAES